MTRRGLMDAIRKQNSNRLRLHDVEGFKANTVAGLGAAMTLEVLLGGE